MKRWIFAIVAMLLFVGTAAAEPGKDRGLHRGWYKHHQGGGSTDIDIRNQWSVSQKQSQVQMQGQSQSVDVGNVTVEGISGATISAGSPVSVQTKAITWPGIPVTVAGDPLPYYGQYKETPMEWGAMPWFRRAKWLRKDFESGYAAHGEVVPAFVQDGSSHKSTYLMTFDGRKGEADLRKKVENTFYIGDITCRSKDAGSSYESVWGVCGPAMMDQGARAAVLVHGYTTDGVSSKKLTGGISGVFMSIFGSLFTAGAGPTIAGSDDTVRPYKHIETTWMCFRPMTQEEIEAAKKGQ